MRSRWGRKKQKDKKVYENVIEILKNRAFIDLQIWKYGFEHHDLEVIKEYLAYSRKKYPLKHEPLRVFEYFPYYSSRAHKYQNDAKSKIRNVQFKQTYYGFLFDNICYPYQDKGR